MKNLSSVCMALVLLSLACSNSSNSTAKLPTLHAAPGIVVKGSTPVAGGLLTFRLDPETPESRDWVVNAVVGNDGKFEIKTQHAQGKSKEPGAPVGSYIVTYLPPSATQNINPSVPKAKVTIVPGTNQLTIDLTK
jgi:hypothetical protein